MELGAAGLSEQPFPTHGKPLTIASYASKVSAIETLNDTQVHPTGVALLQGPPLSGKSTLIRSFVRSLPKDCSVAVIDGKGLNATNLLTSLLRQFGYNLDLSSADVLLGLVRVFALQQTASHEAPLLIIENADELNPGALRTLCELAVLRVRQYSALKMVLVSDRSLQPIMATHAMKVIASRVIHNFHLQPMTRAETREYLYSKLRAAGSQNPESIFSDGVSGLYGKHRADGPVLLIASHYWLWRSPGPSPSPPPILCVHHCQPTPGRIRAHRKSSLTRGHRLLHRD